MRILATVVPVTLLLCLPPSARALEGEPFIHDPSTVVECEGKYYTFGTGGGGLISEDGWTWRGGAVRPGGGAAPDVMKIGDRYLVAYGATGGGLGGGHAGRILTMWNKTLNPESPDFKYSEPVVVASSDGVEDCDAIDPSLFLDPNDGRLWLTYGTYFGFIRIVELDPKTGARVPGNEPVNIAIDCEATALIYRDGWYYLLGTHGTCCDGVNSTYNIRVGRSDKVTGPFVDNMGIDMLRGGGKLVVAANGRLIGPGHFGLIDLGDGVQKFSCHYEADLDRGGRSVLDIRALLWKDGWPVAGEQFMGAVFQIHSERKGYALELAVDFVRMAGGRRGGRGAGRSGEPLTPIPLQTLAEVSTNWPDGNIGLRLGDYMLRPHQKWAVTPVTNAGGYLGSPWFKITIAGTDRTLTATADREVVAAPAFTGAPEQLWRIDQLVDGTFRIMPKAVPGCDEPLALTAIGASTPTLAKFDPESDKARWTFRAP
ncbi:MAG TPA: family 43 glycosylhydrolase [Verrucomicrobia bacterium]|nr:family 43 glycosylhydrolase [Verrucomicrobiota bacterium]HOB32931.1 family 43 glycosylhydrolase [Verrucomicrobiota bacterium]HOP96360.1 family 43 glycosylhydrolase [Verrucomicrobiota bacterium]